MTDEALAWLCFDTDLRQLSFDPELAKGSLNPKMNLMITLFCREVIPFVAGRKNKTVSPVGVVRNNTTSRWTPDEWSQHSQLLYISVSLEIAERGCRLSPSVKSKDRVIKTRRSLEERFIQPHVKSEISRPGSDPKPLHWVTGFLS